MCLSNLRPFQRHQLRRASATLYYATFFFLSVLERTKIVLHPKERDHFAWRHLVRTLKASINITTGLHRFGLLFYALFSQLTNYDKDFQNWRGLDWAFTGCFNLEKFFMNCLATSYSKELLVVSQQSPIKLWSRRMWAQTSWPSVVDGFHPNS